MVSNSASYTGGNDKLSRGFFTVENGKSLNSAMRLPFATFRYQDYWDALSRALESNFRITAELACGGGNPIISSFSVTR